MHTLSEERLAPSNGIEISYQEIGDPDGEPLLLIMGLATQMLAWQEPFCAMLAERGFRVVRFDNRDIGCSTMIDSAGVSSRLDLLRGRRSTAPYLLSDMAADTAGLMDHLEIESAHVVGASMGGMIGQALAIEHPERTRSLVSIMSTTGSKRDGMPTWRAWGVLLSRFPRDRAAYVDRAVKTLRVIGSPAYPMDEQRIRDLAGAMHDRSHRPAGILRQMHAISASGNRTRALGKLRIPVTAIHGTRDPLIRPSGGRATAQAIPGARLRMVEGMGHDFPEALWPLFVDEIADTAARAGEREQAKQPA